MKLGQAAFLSLGALSAYFICFLRSKNAPGWVLAAILLLPALPALPTILMDWYNAQDVTNRDSATVIRNPDMKAVEWIRQNLPSHAVIQSLPIELGQYRFYSLLPTFALRRTALGDSMHSLIFQTNPATHAIRERSVSLLFLSKSAAVSHAVAYNLGIDYLYLGDLETRILQHSLDKFRDPAFFHTVYDRHGVRIVQVLPGPAKGRSHFIFAEAPHPPRLPGVHMFHADKFQKISEDVPGSPDIWRGDPGSVLYFDAFEPYSGILFFRMKTYSAPVELRLVQDQKPLPPILIDSTEWRWVELEMNLNRGINHIQFLLQFPASTVTDNGFRLADVIYFGERSRR
jgi:hypothetical protein